MGSADSYTKEYMNNNHIFADVYNFLLGKDMIDPQKLSDVNVEELYLGTKLPGDTDKDVEKFRDVLKKYATAKTDGRVSYVLLGIENQTAVDYAMPVRLMIYDAMRYHKQLREIAAKHKQAGDLKSSEEFLSKFSKTDRLEPVITVVVYYGSERWNASHDLFGLLDDCYSEFMPLINNYRIKIFEASTMSNEDLQSLKTDLRMVMTFIKGADDMETLLKLLEEDDCFKEMDILPVRVINSVTDANIQLNEDERSINMCKAIRDLRMISESAGEARGEARGEAKGKVKGRIEGLRETALRMLTDKMPIELISKYSGLTIDEIKALDTASPT